MKNNSTNFLLLIICVFIFMILSFGCRSRQQELSGRKKNTQQENKKNQSMENTTHTANHLINEKSPYLLQHADNPVDWYPWSKEAFEKARRENKPIFLSIGYSTCHWCHVMEHESFEDKEVADLMNKVFVCIKVDREERPDIDKLYMNVCQMMTGGGGWPLTIIMTPDKKPFFAGTYFPKKGRFGRQGMMELIPRIEEIWITRQADVINSASQIITALQQSLTITPDKKLDKSILKSAYNQLYANFDNEYGGFGEGVKFPTIPNLLFFLRYWKRTDSEEALSAVETTLQAMRQGGIYDHIGFGIHRYSTDRKWRIPHFEKMLYDQALSIIAYTEAYQATENPEYKITAQEIITYVLRDMTDPEGGFYSAEDADSEGEEGKFYMWQENQIRNTLNKEDADFVIKMFDIKKNGNYSQENSHKKAGSNIIYMAKPFKNIASYMNMQKAPFLKRWNNIRQKLFIAREKRIHPHKDDKILTDWNGLMIVALAKAAQVFDEPIYAEVAEKAADFILQRMKSRDKQLFHRFINGESAIPANLDDYSFMIWGLIDLYEATFKSQRLQEALELNKILVKHFHDNKHGGFFFTANDVDPLFMRQKIIYDGAIPSGNSVAMLNLLRLSRITANSDMEAMAEKTGRAFSGIIQQNPSTSTQLMLAIDFGAGPSYEVVIAGKSQGHDTIEMLKALRKPFIPNKVVLFRPTEQQSPDILHIAKYLETFYSINNHASAYICLNYSCQKPTINIYEMMNLLNEHYDR